MIVALVVDFDDADIIEAGSDFEDVAASLRARLEEVFLGTGENGRVVVDSAPRVVEIVETSLPLPGSS